VVGIASVPVSAAMLAAMPNRRGAYVVALLQLLAGAVFLGAVMDGLLLGHWYLTDRGLTVRDQPLHDGPDRRGRARAAALVLGGFGPSVDNTDFNPLLTSAGLASVDRARMVGTTALIAFLIRAALKGSDRPPCRRRRASSTSP